MSRHEGKRPRSRSNSPSRRGDRYEDRDRRSHKSSRTRSPSHGRDRRSHKESSSRHHRDRDRRSRSRSPEDTRRASSHRSNTRDRHEKSSRDDRGTSSRSEAKPTAPKPELVEQARNQLVEIGLAPEVAAKRATEQAELDEEIRKRREKVKAWQEAKRLKEEQERLQESGGGTNSGVTSDGVVAGATEGDASGSSQTSRAPLAGAEVADADTAAPSGPTAQKPHNWSLEDEDEEEDAAQSAPIGGSGAEDLAAPASPTHVTKAEEDEGDVFEKLSATPVKHHADHAHSQNNALAHVTAMSLAASVAGGSAANNESTATGAARSRKPSRLKSSRWDTGDHDDTTSTGENNNNHSAGRSRSGSISGPGTGGLLASPPAGTGITVPSAPQLQQIEEEEIDPLEAFMSSLYSTGDVAEQKDLAIDAPGGNNHHAPAQPQVITLEDILAGKVPGATNHDSPEAPPSPQFAPALQNYPSSSTLMAKSPSLRTLAMANSASFDNLNRGWESDAPEGGGDYSVGRMDVDDADGLDDDGEESWQREGEAAGGKKQKAPPQRRDADRMDVSTDSQQQQQQRRQKREAQLKAALAGLSESEAEPEIPETEEEREARELREKQEFIEAIRRARAEEDQVRERLSRMEEEAAASAAAKAKASGGSAGAAGAGAGTEEVPTAKKEELGRIFSGDGDMLEEYEHGEGKKRSALEILEDAKKGKLLKEVDHSKIQYLPFRKNLYIVPRALSKLTEAEVIEKREDLQIKVRGKGCPVPVDTWEQCGLSDRVLETVHFLKLKEPFAIQKQAIPAIMCGRDVIGVAKTGSGKTLAFLLPMLRHILDQPPLMDGEGPIGLIMAPARELASQIYQEAKKFTKPLGLRVACIYGGAAVAEQIADLKRGSEIVVCTPGRMIDILCMQAGKLVSLRRVTMVVMDEADRMFDMGFEPQIKMIIQNVRPDRQTVLFSATFPKQIEKLARSVLRMPLEIIVGERSTVNKDITQIVEVHEEEDKFLRLLQLLGIWYEKGSVLIFVETQDKCDQLFQDLLKLGYPCLSLHGGKEQVDRDHTLYEFKKGIKTVMVATSLAGRGLDVPEIVCVVNYHCPNHIEAYVHQVGRTGRAGRKGTAYTFVSQREDQYAPSMVKVLQKANVPVPPELSALADAFREKVKRGEAHWAASGFEGEGYTFKADEMNQEQKIANMQQRAYKQEQGLLPVDTGAEGDEEDSDDERAPVSGLGTAHPSSSSLAGLPAPGVPGAGVAVPIAAAPAVGVPVVGAAPPVVAAPAVPVITPDMTPLERAKAMAAAIAANRLGAAAVPAPVPPAVPGLVPTSSGPPIDPMAAVARARLIAMQMGAAGKATKPGEEHFTDEIEINDYPHQARRKVTGKAVMDEICDRAGVAVISRGAYVAPGKKPEAGERKLYLLIEGPSEISVMQAKREILKVLEDETIRLTTTGSLATSGRYSVL